jgi:hypothetical protein
MSEVPSDPAAVRALADRLDAEDGTELWRIDAGEQPQRPTVAVDREAAFFARSDGVYTVADEK